jgi:hypothetical protein
VEIEKLIRALEVTVEYLQRSQSSDWASMSVDEIIQELGSLIAKAKDSQQIDTNLLGFLFGPTGPIQETSIDNGWGDEFLKISEVVDQFTEKH